MNARLVDVGAGVTPGPCSPPRDAGDVRVAEDHDACLNDEEAQRLEAEVEFALQCRCVAGALAPATQTGKLHQ